MSCPPETLVMASIDISVRQRLNKSSNIEDRNVSSIVFGRLQKNITFADINDTIVRHIIKLRKLISDLITHPVNWIVDPFKCEISIATIPEEPSGLPEAILVLRSKTEARIQICRLFDVKSCKGFLNCM